MSASRAMKAPDTSPRWDWSSWQIDATPRALRTAAREGAPGREGADPNRPCRKKGLCIRQLCLRLKAPPPPNAGRAFCAGPGLLEGRFDRASGHHGDQVRAVVDLRVQV